MATVLRVLLFSLLTASLAWAQTVATITSTAPFTLRDAAVNPTQGVPSFPILANDAMKAGNAPAIITFPDGSVITLAPNAEGRIEVINGRPLFRLVSGEATYNLKTLTAVTLANGGSIVTPAQLTGILQTGTSRSGVGFWTTRNTALVLGGAGAAAGLGVGLTQALAGGGPVSPSQP